MQVEFKESFAKDLSIIDARTLQKVKRIIEKLENDKITLIRFLHPKEMYRYFP